MGNWRSRNSRGSTAWSIFSSSIFGVLRSFACKRVSAENGNMRFLFLFFSRQVDTLPQPRQSLNQAFVFSFSRVGNWLSVQPFSTQTLVKVETKKYYARQPPFCLTQQARQMGPGYDGQEWTGEWSQQSFPNVWSIDPIDHFSPGGCVGIIRAGFAQGLIFSKNCLNRSATIEAKEFIRFRWTNYCYQTCQNEWMTELTRKSDCSPLAFRRRCSYFLNDVSQ